MKKLNPEYIERVTQFVNRCPYFELLSMKLLDVGLGFSLLEINLAEKHLQPFGFVHGGFMLRLSTLLPSGRYFAGLKTQTPAPPLSI